MTPAEGRHSGRRHSRSRGGGSPELGVYSPPDLGFRCGLHLQHGCDLENLFAHLGRTAGNNGGGCGRGGLARLGSSSTSMSAGSSGYKKQSYGFLVSSSSSLTAQLLAGGGESSSRGDVLLALRLRFVGKIRRAWATIYRAFGTYA
jgi:hypothetical protein